MTEERQRELMRAVIMEAKRSHPYFNLPIVFDLASLFILVASLQLALRHPENTGPSADGARRIVSGIIARVRAEGLDALADAMEAGNDPANDIMGGARRAS
jgi:hypothetical protein